MSSENRLVGVDLARSVALLGMCVVHFVLVGGRTGPDSGDALAGRPAALFVVLSGIGVTLLTRRAVKSGDPAQLRATRRTLLRRGLFLLAVGFANLVIWPGDILRVYGIALIAAAALFDRRPHWLLVAAGGSVLTFLGLMMALDFEQNWDLTTLEYRNLWTPAGAVRNLFFDGFRTVFPWTAFLFVGMWLGRLDLADRRVSRRLIASGLIALVAAESASAALVRHFAVHPNGLKPGDVQAVFGTGSIPPLPLFLLAAGGTALLVLGLCVRIGDGLLVRLAAAPGRLALTWYLLHIVVGMGGLVAFDLTQTLSTGTAVAAGAMFWLGAAVVSAVYSRWFRLGPAEAVMRGVGG
jgi:uncharacterized protein